MRCQRTGAEVDLDLERKKMKFMWFFQEKQENEALFDVQTSGIAAAF